MRRFTCVALLALLVLSPIGTAASAPAVPADTAAERPTPSADVTSRTSISNDTTRRLELDTVSTQGYGTPGLDLGAAVVMNRETVDNSYRLELLSVRLGAASSDEARQALVETAIEDVESRVDTLQQQERQAIEAYGAGDISERELLKRLALVGYRAEQTKDTIGRLERSTGASLGYLTRQANEYSTPTRSALFRTLNNERDGSLQAQVQGSQSGVVIQLLAQSGPDLEYYREAVRLDHWDTDTANGFDNRTEFLEYTESRYPYVRESSGVNIWEFRRGSWFYESPLDQGSIRIYVDGSQRKVYREYQQLTVSALPVSNSVNATDYGVEVVINETANGGPARIQVQNVLSGDAIAAPVMVDGTVVGQTNEDGVHWFTQPSGAYEVTVDLPQGPINVTVSS
ncbi:DUF7096 domain-containing protein [Haloarchaeobius sp. TZWSO28]|uniref:DUF7096 domain-containing protein n=1 Tax=Haloarchaeobius sp. TZWSO28 TaxID=3446119 RepID=UPI003EB92DE1